MDFFGFRYVQVAASNLHFQLNFKQSEFQKKNGTSKINKTFNNLHRMISLFLLKQSITSIKFFWIPQMWTFTEIRSWRVKISKRKSSDHPAVTIILKTLPDVNHLAVNMEQCFQFDCFAWETTIQNALFDLYIPKILFSKVLKVIFFLFLKWMIKYLKSAKFCSAEAILVELSQKLANLSLFQTECLLKLVIWAP